MLNKDVYLSAVLSEEVYSVGSPRRTRQNNVDYIKIVCPDESTEIFEIIKEMDLKKGFQGAAYRNVSTNEIIVAFRGTEVSLKKPLESFRDLKADAEMIFLRKNPQFEESKQITKFALEYADKLSMKTSQPVAVSLTGHSLGGSIAQFNAHYYGSRISQTHTFNAYGVESLGYGIPKEKVPTVKNHVMATDFVSAASHHYGDVVIYADKSDIKTLNMTCYRNKENTLISGLVLTATMLSAKKHGISNFTQKDVLYTRKNEDLAIERKHQINNYRSDVFRIRSIASAVNLPKTVKCIFFQETIQAGVHHEKEIANTHSEYNNFARTVNSYVINGNDNNRYHNLQTLMEVLTNNPEQFDRFSKDFIENGAKKNPIPGMVTPDAAVMDKVPPEHRSKFPAALKDKIISDSKQINTMLKNNTLTGINQTVAKHISAAFQKCMIHESKHSLSVAREHLAAEPQKESISQSKGKKR